MQEMNNTENHGPDHACLTARRVLITSGNGFLGSHLIDRLVRRGVTVHAIANTNHQRLDTLLPPEQIHILRSDPYSASELVTRLQPNAIFHLAAVYAEPISIECIASMFSGNLSLGAALLYGVSQCKRPAVFLNTGTYWQFSETGEYSPNTVYASTKQAFQYLLTFYARKGDVSATTLVLYDTFGEGDTRSKLWSMLIESPSGATIPLSAGEQLIELVHQSDIVDAFMHAADLLLAQHPLEAVYSLRSGVSVRLKDLILGLNERSQLGLTLDWAAPPYWEGQVLRPWQGPMLPGWQPQVDVLDELVAMAARRRFEKDTA
jgi:nucleoside-diphosphate-sugar epimerase